jgi:hypothetical protein
MPESDDERRAEVVVAARVEMAFVGHENCWCMPGVSVFDLVADPGPHDGFCPGCTAAGCPTDTDGSGGWMRPCLVTGLSRTHQ